VRGDRDPLIGFPRAHDAADGGRQPAYRLDGGLSREPPPGERQHDDRDGHQGEDGAEPGEQIAARLGALAHLDECAAPQRKRANLEARRIPSLDVAEHQRLGPAIDDPDEQPFGRRRLLGAHRLGQRAQPPASVDRGVFAKLRIDDLAVALRQ
jgi:hypothetical protein